MDYGVLATDPAEEFFTEERCYILELSNSGSDKNASVAQARVEPGVTTQLHRLNGVEERCVITRGRGLMEVGGREPVPVAPGTVVLVPAGAAQRITNSGDEDLLFLCVCTPRFAPQCYEALGK